MTDPGNPTNAWQGSIRSGPLDLVLLDYAARVCKIDALAVTCLDQLPARPRICTHYADTSRLEIPGSLREQSALTALAEAAVPVYQETTPAELLDALGQIAPVALTASGPTSGDWESTSDLAGRWPSQSMLARTSANARSTAST